MSEPVSEEGRQALDTLRAVWTATGQMTDPPVISGDTPDKTAEE